ncbi:MAG: hypothetical protein OEV35_03880 [Gallionellaceae bacterium]|nr:hypothetical protein [Gallionellaceae bacterium]
MGEICSGLKLPALETMLARARQKPLAQRSLEAWLCDVFGVPGFAIAPATLLADGMEPGSSYWLRADPAHVYIRQNEMILEADVPLSVGEAEGLCASLNGHFSGEGLRFFAPHPQRWYVQLDSDPAIQTHLLSQAAGRDIRALLPQGEEALRWHAVLNEIQMLFHDHAVNQVRAARGDPPINSVWLWGGGRMEQALSRPFVRVCGDGSLAEAFARAAGVSFVPLPGDVNACLGKAGNTLLVWEGLQQAILRGDMQAWRDELQQFEQHCAVPLLDALRAGRITQITLDVPGEAAYRFTLGRNAAWKFWCCPRPLSRLALR